MKACSWTKAIPILISVVILMGAQGAFAVHKGTLERGAAFFMDYCAGCHSLKYLRPDPVIGNQYPILPSMPAIDARQWFGRVPPDLSLIARERGSTWVYSYLTHFYADPTRPFGSNNALVPNVAMPNVLAPFQNHEKLDNDLRDVVSFLEYVAEPTKRIRYRIGLVVMVFLAVFVILIWRLKRLYWRNICENFSTTP